MAVLNINRIHIDSVFFRWNVFSSIAFTTKSVMHFHFNLCLIMAFFLSLSFSLFMLKPQIVSFEDSQFKVVKLSAEKVLEFIEQAYPNPITPEDLAR